MKKIFLLILLSLTTISCTKDDSPNNDNSLNNENPSNNQNSSDQKFILPFITTLYAQNVSLTQAAIAGNVDPSPLSVGDNINGYKNTIQSKGFIWGENANLTFNNSTKITLDNTFGDYSATINSLKPNTKYYFNTYASNANNETTFGQEMSFTTAGEAPCSYTKDDYLTTVYSKYGPSTISSVTLTTPSGFNDGNLEFEARTNSIIRIIIQLNEKGGKLPLSGNYNGVYEFNNQSVKSSNGAKIDILDYNGYYDFFPQGDQGDSNTKFYINNDSQKITFIFCNTKVGDYVLNGKYSYTIK